MYIYTAQAIHAEQSSLRWVNSQSEINLIFHGSFDHLLSSIKGWFPTTGPTVHATVFRSKANSCSFQGSPRNWARIHHARTAACWSTHIGEISVITPLWILGLWVNQSHAPLSLMTDVFWEYPNFCQICIKMFLFKIFIWRYSLSSCARRNFSLIIQYFYTFSLISILFFLYYCQQLVITVWSNVLL